MNCAACQYPLPADALFCPECGVKVEGARGRASETVPAAAEPAMAEAAVGSAAAGEAVRSGAPVGPGGVVRGGVPSSSRPPVVSSPAPIVSRGTNAMDALLARANLLRMRGQWAEAIDRCTEALRLDPHSGAAHSLLGDIYENQGRLDKASHWYQLALEQNPDSIADKAKLARVRELQAVRKRTGDPRFSWAYLVAVAGVAFLFVAFVMAAIVANDRGDAINAPALSQPTPEFPPSARPRIQPLDHTDGEEKLANYLIAELHSQIMTVVTVMLHPAQREAMVTVRLGDRPVTPDPLGGSPQDHILREGYRIAYMARQLQHEQKQELRRVTVRALKRISTPNGTGRAEEVWRGQIDVRRIVATDDKASVNEVRSVYDLPGMYWNRAVGF